MLCPQFTTNGTRVNVLESFKSVMLGRKHLVYTGYDETQVMVHDSGNVFSC